MADLKHFNTTAGSPPYRSLFSNITIVPANTSLAYISTQWAADSKTGELVDGVADDYRKQSEIVWKNITGILKELGVEFKDVVHRTVSFKNFDESVGKDVVEGMMSVLPVEWHGDALKSALTYQGMDHFHRPGIVYSVDIIVAVPGK